MKTRRNKSCFSPDRIGRPPSRRCDVKRIYYNIMIFFFPKSYLPKRIVHRRMLTQSAVHIYYNIGVR